MIEAVAEVLIEKRTLSGQEVCSIIQNDYQKKFEEKHKTR
jgi:hypothetical protein